jgi:hypothetical protein
MNLFAGAMGGGGMQAAGMGSSMGTPSNVQQMQAQAVQDARIDSLCPGKQRSSTNIGAECWAAVWANGGCKAENVPQFEDWHSAQSLEVLVADVVQWANLPDERHKQGCYGSSGAPVNEPAPPQPQGGLGIGGGMGMGGGMGGGMGLGGGLGLGGAPAGAGASPLGLGGGMGLGQMPMQQQGPAPAPEVMQKIEASLQSPELANLCPGVTRQSTAVGEACWKKIWTHAGCLEQTTPGYESWHNAQSMEVLVADAAQWATLPSDTHKKACYGPGMRAEL